MLFETLGLDCQESGLVLCGIHYGFIGIALGYVISLLASIFWRFYDSRLSSVNDISVEITDEQRKKSRKDRKRMRASIKRKAKVDEKKNRITS